MDLEQFDLAIVGCGPAGMSAALNAKIRRKSFVLLGTPICAERLQKAPMVDNYLGLPEVRGDILLEKFQTHLKRMNIQVENAKATNIFKDDQGFSLVSRDRLFQARSLILCTGVSPSGLIPGEAGFIGRGAGYCATCDGPLYRGKKVGVIAYHPDGEEEANYLAAICQGVVYIPQYKNRGELDPRIKVVEGRPTRISGAEVVSQIELGDKRIPVDGVFILRENMPAEQLLTGLEMREGAIVVDKEMRTSIAGAYAAGDCTGKPYQLAKAVGEGGVAALSAVKYLDSARVG